MKQEKLFIPVMLGTVRKGRRSEAVARWLLDRMVARDDMETKLIDPRELNLPNDNDGPDLVELNKDFQQTVMNSDGLVIVSPEYNHSYPGILKRMIDILYKESYGNKAVGSCGVSRGMFGGARMMEHLHSLTHTVGLIQSQTDLYAQNAVETVSEDGQFNPDDEFIERADAFLNDLAWLATTLRWGRNQLKN